MSGYLVNFVDKVQVPNAVKRLFYVEKDCGGTFLTIGVHSKMVYVISELSSGKMLVLECVCS